MRRRGRSARGGRRCRRALLRPHRHRRSRRPTPRERRAWAAPLPWSDFTWPIASTTTVVRPRPDADLRLSVAVEVGDRHRAQVPASRRRQWTPAQRAVVPHQPEPAVGHHDLGARVGIKVSDRHKPSPSRGNRPEQRSVRAIGRRAGDHLGNAVAVEVGGHGSQTGHGRAAHHRTRPRPPHGAIAVQDLAADHDLLATVAVKVR